MMDHSTVLNIKPYTVFLTWLLAAISPQAFLLLSNVHAWGLAGHLADPENSQYAAYLVTLQGCLLSLNIAVAVLVLIGRFKVNFLAVGLLLISHVAALLAVLMWFEQAVPRRLPVWMLNTQNTFYSNIALLMPAAFISLYAAIKLFRQFLSTAQIVLGSLASVIALPVVLYLVASLLQPFTLGQFGVVLGVLFSTLFMLVFLAGIVTLLDVMLTNRLFSDAGRTHYGLVLLLGLVAPIGGLILNSDIPFPSDFQSPWVYVFTVFNALVLAWPVANSVSNVSNWGKARSCFFLYLRGVTYPFIAYFFLVFLPFLPLSIFAILAVGVGILMLTPLALGIFQTRITWLEFNRVRAQTSLSQAVLVLSLGLLSLPALFLLQAKFDQRSLDKTLNYFYAAEQHQQPLSALEIARTTQALIRLRDNKKGVQLPYIASVYNNIVYGGMVLNDAKIEQLHQWLNNKPMPEFKPSDFAYGRSASRARWRNGGRVVKPSSDTKIEKASVVKVNSESSRLVLRLRNYSEDTHAIYRTSFQLPEGVFITGLRLKINGEWANGHVHDKKTAIWVFEKITEVRRDPAIIYYENANTVQLRVYPFPASGVREVELSLNYHPSVATKISIDDQHLVLNQPDFNPGAIALFGDDNTILVNTSSLVESSPQGLYLESYVYQREPYLHFILPLTAGTEFKPKRWLSQIQSLAKTLGQSTVAVSGANISVSHNAVALVNVNDSNAVLRQISEARMASEGGLWLVNALSRLITKHQNSEYAHSHSPRFVVLFNDSSARLENVEIADWQQRLPDAAGWWAYQNDELFKHVMPGDDEQRIISVKYGSRSFIIPLNASRLLPAQDDASLQLYQAELKQWRPGNLVASMSNKRLTWHDHAALWLTWQSANTSPALLQHQRAELLALSQGSGMVLPSTAAIVVENAAQREILRRKEKQAMGQHSALSFDEPNLEDQQQTPEPAEWLMILGLLFYLLRKHLLGQSHRFSQAATSKVAV